MSESEEFFQLLAECDVSPRCKLPACPACEIARLRELVESLSPPEGWAKMGATSVQHWFTKGRKSAICGVRGIASSVRDAARSPDPRDCAACAFTIAGGKVRATLPTPKRLRRGGTKETPKGRIYPKGVPSARTGWAPSDATTPDVPPMWHWYRKSTGSACGRTVHAGAKIATAPRDARACRHCENSLRASG